MIRRISRALLADAVSHYIIVHHEPTLLAPSTDSVIHGAELPTRGISCLRGHPRLEDDMAGSVLALRSRSIALWLRVCGRLVAGVEILHELTDLCCDFGG